MTAAMIPTVIALFHPHQSSLSIALSEETTVQALRQDILAKYVPVERQKLLLASGRPLGLWKETCTIRDVLRDEHGRQTLKSGGRGESDRGPEHETLFLQLGVRMCGGKGGFGSQLRAAGGRMSSSKKSNRHRKKTQDEIDAEMALCRDLSGRRIKTITEARQLATHMENSAERERIKEEARLKKLEQAMKLVEAQKRGSSGISSTPSATSVKRPVDEAEAEADHEPLSSLKSSTVTQDPPKERFADREFLQEKAKIQRGVKSALAQALAQQRAAKHKKPRLDAAQSTTTDAVVV